jgi:hypothetical protein
MLMRDQKLTQGSHYLYLETIPTSVDLLLQLLIQSK